MARPLFETHDEVTTGTRPLFREAQTALTTSQKAFDASQVFYSPLQNVATGQQDQTLQHSIGAAKGALGEFASAGAQNAGPIGADMKAHANGFFDDLDTTLKPTNTAQATGMADTQLGAMLLGGGKAIKELAKGTGLADWFASRAATKELNNTVKSITPKLTSREMEGANVITPKRGAPYVDMSSDPTFVERAKTVQGLVKGKDKNIDVRAVEDRISQVAQDELKPHLAQNKVPVNFEDVRTKLSLTTPPDNLKGISNEAAKTAWDHAREVMLGNLDTTLKREATKVGDFTAPTDMNHLWDAAKVATDKAERELKFDFGTPQYAGTKAAVQQFRGDIYQFIEDALKYPGQMERLNQAEEFVQRARGTGIQLDTPEQISAFLKQMGITTDADSIANASFFKNKIKELRNLYGVRDDLRTWLPDYVKGNQQFSQRHPHLTKAGEIGIAATGLGAIGAAGKYVYDKTTGQ